MAGHFVARDLSLGQGAAPVRARVVDREELTIDVEEGDLFSIHLDQTRLTRLDLSCPRCLHKVSPSIFSSYLRSLR